VVASGVGMNYRGLTSDNAVFILISLEGPDSYSLTGGLGVRMAHLSGTLADVEFPTQMFFIGAPELKGGRD
jgi:hypothetical protein